MKNWYGKLSRLEYNERKWNTTKARRKFLGQKCENCGTDDRLEIHHKDRDWRNNGIDNLQTLCSRCHMKWHHSQGHIFPEDKKNRKCSVEECGNRHKGHGYCEMHLDRLKVRGTLEKRPPKPRLPCEVCGKPFEPLRSRGNLCNIHRKVKERYGDPFAKQVGRNGGIKKQM